MHSYDRRYYAATDSWGGGSIHAACCALMQLLKSGLLGPGLTESF